LLHKDEKLLRKTVAAANQANEELIRQGILPVIKIEDNKLNGSEKITCGDMSVMFTKDGATKEYSDPRNPNNMTKMIRRDGSSSELIRDAENTITVLLNTDKNGKQTKVEAKDGKTIKFDDETGAITTTNPDGTKTVQRSDGVVEHRDKNDRVTSYSDSAGNTIKNGNVSMQCSVDSAVGRMAGIFSQMNSGDPANVRNCMDQLYAILGQLDPLVTAADPTVAATARNAHVLVSSAMSGMASRSTV